ncbi:Aminotransferase class IV [Dillenia turbinata]|uniref:Aminotransferase class IV n=1 Tax=Dillenia turbinata TaxID=194707 RepID=A0AAN8ULB3_9MAGN
MVYPSNLAKPISQNPQIFPNFEYHSSNSIVVSQNLQIRGHGFQSFRLGVADRSLRELSAIRSSSQPEAFADSTVLSDVPLLTSAEAERLKTKRESWKGKQQFLAMYSSIFGGIIADPSAMVIPMDDHIIYIEDMAFLILQQYMMAPKFCFLHIRHLYELDQHLDRFLKSASMAKIKIPFDWESIQSILIQTVAVSKCTTGSLKYWLSAGPGDFQLSLSGCHEPSLYAVVIHNESPFVTKGVKVITTAIPNEPP